MSVKIWAIYAEVPITMSTQIMSGHSIKFTHSQVRLTILIISILALHKPPLVVLY